MTRPSGAQGWGSKRPKGMRSIASSNHGPGAHGKALSGAILPIAIEQCLGAVYIDSLVLALLAAKHCPCGVNIRASWPVLELAPLLEIDSSNAVSRQRRDGYSGRGGKGGPQGE